MKPPLKPAAAASLPNEVRIIGGTWRRSKLPVANKPGLRPSPDRVRTTLFNWLPHELSGWRCIDAFAGSGALGFEAASRGASQVTLIERDPHLARSLRETKDRLKAGAVTVEAADALAWLRRCAPGACELVFVDPPFDAGLSEQALSAALRVVVPDGLVYFEADHPVEDSSAGLFGCTVHRHSRAGAVHFHLLRKSAQAAG